MSGPPCTLLACCTLLLAASGALAQMPPDDNDTALETWSETTGSEAPLLVAEGDGTTRLAWTSSAHLDLYAREASGDALVTPYSSGGFYAAGVAAEWRDTAPMGRLAAAGATSSNDRALLPTAAQLDTFQADAQAGTIPHGRRRGSLNSALSTSTVLRGVAHNTRSRGSRCPSLPA
jgi:hypothetical protein